MVLETACGSPLPPSASVRLRALLHVEYLGEAVLPLPPGVGLRGEGGHEGAHTWLGLGLELELGLGLGLGNSNPNPNPNPNLARVEGGCEAKRPFCSVACSVT